MPNATSDILNQIFDDYQTFSCTRKVTYNTQESARSAAVAISRKGQGHVFAYKCSFCNNWHVGHKVKVRKTVKSGVRSASADKVGLEGSLGEYIVSAIQCGARPSWLKFVRRISARISEWEINIRSMQIFRIRYRRGFRKSGIIQCIENGGDL